LVPFIETNPNELIKIGLFAIDAFPEAVPAIFVTVDPPRVKLDDFEKS
jgi:hypothetical protein